MIATIKDIENKVDTQALITRSLNDWRTILCNECQVYVCDENFIAKRFDQINYKFCNKNTAKDILVDNLYAILRFKYFPQMSEEVDNRIGQIVSSFTVNLKTTLKKVSFDEATNAELVKMLPQECIAFRNGVFNFRTNNWLFKYDIQEMPQLHNCIYDYTYKYIILWYLNFDFEPLPLNIMNVDMEKFLDTMKNTCKNKATKNMCFELIYNMSHNIADKFDSKKFEHLCEVMGYSILQSFTTAFVIFIGGGGNGKNSLFDGCLTSHVIPMPTSNSLDAFENDRFITGALENKAQSIFLESVPKTYSDCTYLKNITGSMYQTIERKGEQKYSSIINCKYIFSCNNQNDIKFSDTSPGFRRRINMIELWYQWDAEGRYLKRGDYYDVVLSDDYHELKSDISNAIMFVYFGMYGILKATNKFTSKFKFTENDWNLQYTDADIGIKDAIDITSIHRLYNFIKSLPDDEAKSALFDVSGRRLYLSTTLSDLGYRGYDDMMKLLGDDQAATSYFVDNDCYISVRALQKLAKGIMTASMFTQNIKKIYNVTNMPNLYNNKPYVKITFVNDRIKILQK